MRDRIGDRFEGTVSGFSGQGMFVTLDSPFVDGMVRLQQMERELGNAFEADGTGVRLVGSGGKLITIGDRVRIQAQSGIGRNVKDDEVLQGSPALNYGDYNKSYVHFKNLPKLNERVTAIEKNINDKP